VNLPRSVVLVEGNSDRVALHTLAQCLGRDLEAEGVEVVAMGGITNTRAFATRYGPHGLGLPLSGLYDVGEESVLRRGLAAAGLPGAVEPGGPERLGFYACSSDLEDELIRALGPAFVEAVVESEGDLGSFRTFQKQPAWRGQPVDGQLRRFMGSADRRKLRYARLLVDAIDLDDVPRPLDGVLASSLPWGGQRSPVRKRRQ
jgi:hypothetical protein